MHYEKIFLDFFKIKVYYNSLDMHKDIISISSDESAFLFDFFHIYKNV